MPYELRHASGGLLYGLRVEDEPSFTDVESADARRVELETTTALRYSVAEIDGMQMPMDFDVFPSEGDTPPPWQNPAPPWTALLGKETANG